MIILIVKMCEIVKILTPASRCSLIFPLCFAHFLTFLQPQTYIIYRFWYPLTNSSYKVPQR